MTDEEKLKAANDLDASYASSEKFDRTNQDRAYREAAQKTYAEEGRIEIDADAKISRGDGGAYVAAWVWVAADDEEDEGEKR